jgi:hypothetical protein
MMGVLPRHLTVPQVGLLLILSWQQDKQSQKKSTQEDGVGEA